MPDLSLLRAPVTAAPPSLGPLLAGFALLLAGLASLTVRRRRVPLQTPKATARALFYVLVYGLCSACFYRLIAPALLGHDRSPWLWALGDVMFVTLGLFAWVMALAEGHSPAAYGLRGAPPARLSLALVLGILAALLFSLPQYRALFGARSWISADAVVFATLFAAAGSAFPEEMIVRGYLQGSLEGRFGRWARVALPALIFTAVRSARFSPGHDLSVADWLRYLLGVVLPMGLWWGALRELSGGSLWPSLLSHFCLEFGNALAAATPERPS